MSIEDRLIEALKKRIDQGNLRQLSNREGLVDFCSNDYLGMSQNNVLKKKIEGELLSCNYKNGATGSRLISGNSVEQVDLESYLSHYFQGESALLFNSGYNANLGVLSVIPQRGDVIFYDELVHASIKDGMRLSAAKRVRFNHNDLADLERKILAHEAQNIFVVVESVYSMDGDECPLVELVQLAKKHNAAIILDEAHSTGVVGDKGAGMAVDLALEKDVFARIYTFGKAVGVHGACVVGSKSLIDYLINFSRSFIYTTALPTHSIVAIKCAFELLIDNKSREELKITISEFIENFNKIIENKLLRISSNSPIQAILIPGNSRVKIVANYLNEKGYDVRPILSPTVKEGEERLRICLHNYNTKTDIEGMLNALNKALK